MYIIYVFINSLLFLIAVLAKGRPLPSGAKAGIVCRVRRWLGKRICHFVHHKRGEKYRKTGKFAFVLALAFTNCNTKGGSFH